MKSDKKNIIYTAADIEKYLSGNLSAGQMHEMEKAALEDPFLAEAMEGYEGMKEENWKDQLAAARRQIIVTGSEAKVIPMHRSAGRWWKAAAAVLVIGSGAALTFILTKDRSAEKTGPQIAHIITSDPDPGTAKDKSASLPETESKQPVSSPGKEKIISANGTITQVNPQGGISGDDLIYKPGNAPLTDSVKQGTLNVPSSANNNVMQAEETAIAKNKEAPKQNNSEPEVLKRQTNPVANKKEQALNNYFNAQVVAVDNSPLPFTNISIKSENFGTYADVKGNFRLVSADTQLNIEVRSVGYQPRTFTLRSNQPQNKIVLLEDEVAIKEKTVIQNTDNSSNRRSRRASLLIDSVVNAEPADGWENYNTYVANNIDISEDMEKKDFHGEVELLFDVRSNGNVSNIRINKSLGPSYDKAAKRLIEQGPQWKVKKGKKTSASIKVRF